MFGAKPQGAGVAAYTLEIHLLDVNAARQIGSIAFLVFLGENDTAERLDRITLELVPVISGHVWKK